MRINEANRFLKAFKNPVARDFVRGIKISNYTDSILEHHPRKERLYREKISGKCSSLIDSIFRQIENVQDTPGELFPLLHKLSRKNPRQDKIWFAEFDEAYNNYKHNRKLHNRYRQLKPYLSGSSYCDIGCGGGDLVAFLKKTHPAFKVCAGIDVLDWRTDEIRDEINFQMLDFSQPGSRSKFGYDTVTCLAVLHHVGNTDDELSVFLNNVRTAINENGRLIVEEDVILPAYQVNSDPHIRAQVEKLSARQPLFAEFLEFPEDDQKDITIIIDILSNALCGGLPQMAFPCGFRSLGNWQDIFSRNYFEISDIEVLGYVDGGFNRSGHVLFILNPES